MAHHNHYRSPAQSGRRNSLTRAFVWGIVLNMVYVVVEAVFGIATSSMGLISDAGHNLSDVASLVIALVAYKVASKKPTDRFTFGYSRATVEASVINALILYMAVALILVESLRKLMNPAEVDGDVIAWVAGIGVVINGLTAWFLMRDSRNDLNVRGAFLHMIADTLVSVGVVISGIVIHFTGWSLIDPIVGIVIAAVIAVSSYGLLRGSLRMSLDGVPDNIDINAIRQSIIATEGVNSLHHLHIWPLSTTETAMTVHVIVRDPVDIDATIVRVRECVRRLGISHSTIEAETAPCSECTD